jgi:hypothetical protein
LGGQRASRRRRSASLELESGSRHLTISSRASVVTITWLEKFETAETILILTVLDLPDIDLFLAYALLSSPASYEIHENDRASPRQDGGSSSAFGFPRGWWANYEHDNPMKRRGA